MHFRFSLPAQACALALGATLLQGCDSSEKFTTATVSGQSSSDTVFVPQVAPNNGEDNTDGETDPNDGGDGGDGDGDGDDGDGDGGDGDGGGGDGDGDDGDGDGGDGDGDDGDGDGGDGDGDGGDGDGDDGDGDGGDGDGDDGDGDGGDGDDGGNGDNGGGSLGPSSSELAKSALNYTASHANLARFAHALTLGSYNTGSTYSCAGGGSATLNPTLAGSSEATPTWNFSNCILSSETGVNVTYNGQLSSSCEAAARTGIENALYCDAVFTQFQSSYADQTTVYTGSFEMITESESLTTVAAEFSTRSGDDVWTSQSQTIATESSEMRGLNSRIDTNKDGLALTIQGHDGYQEASSGCLTAGTVQVKDANSTAEISIAAAVGGNMLVDDGISSATIACSELSSMPYTNPQLN